MKNNSLPPSDKAEHRSQSGSRARGYHRADIPALSRRCGTGYQNGCLDFSRLEQRQVLFGNALQRPPAPWTSSFFPTSSLSRFTPPQPSLNKLLYSLLQHGSQVEHGVKCHKQQASCQKQHPVAELEHLPPDWSRLRPPGEQRDQKAAHRQQDPHAHHGQSDVTNAVRQGEAEHAALADAIGYLHAPAR